MTENDYTIDQTYTNLRHAEHLLRDTISLDDDIHEEIKAITGLVIKLKEKIHQQLHFYKQDYEIGDTFTFPTRKWQGTIIAIRDNIIDIKSSTAPPLSMGLAHKISINSTQHYGYISSVIYGGPHFKVTVVLVDSDIYDHG